MNYPLGKHYKEREFYSEFLEILPLNEWKSSGNNEFQQRIDELTETFKGRTLEREKLLQFVASKNKGYLSIQGNPGIGKSALIAQFFKDLKHHEISKSLRTVEYFIRRGTPQARVEFMLAYLIRRTDEFFPAGKEVRAEGKTTYDVQSQLFAKWRMWSEQSKGQRLLFLIDGLDEAPHLQHHLQQRSGHPMEQAVDALVAAGVQIAAAVPAAGPVVHPPQPPRNP